jgi:signal transduction histidine kinase
MTYAFLVVLAVAIGLAIAMYFQMKANRKQADEQQKLLTDYQRRVDEQQKLLDDYRALEKNFDSVGEGYEQALLAFDKMEEDQQKSKAVNDALQAQVNQLQEANARMTESATRQSAIMKTLVSDMLRHARENGDAKLTAFAGRISDMGDVDAQEPISRTDNVMVTQISTDAIIASGIDKVTYLQFQQDIAPDAAATMLSTNAQKAARALTHLLDNALKFTTDGGVKLSVKVDMDKMQAIYAVEDTGSGIEAADAERIFEPYVKLNQYFDGEGVGLAVARGIARRMGGDVILDATYGGPGARFVLELPL